MRLVISILILTFLFIGCSNKKKNEKYYQTILCNEIGGIMEYKLKDDTRVDCLTSTYAIEVDWAKKWAEAVGQSLYYSIMTKRKPAIALIVDSEDTRFIDRAERISNKFDIKIFIINKE